jgi:putative phosphoesterase
MRLAVLADIHGNSWALDAARADAAAWSPDGYVVLGDLAADGPDPVGALARLRDLSPAWTVQGNTDRYLGRLDRLGPPRSDLPDLVETWRWGVAQIGEDGRRYLDGLPNTLTLDTPASAVLLTHGIPGDDETGISPGWPDNLAALQRSGARVVLVGHTHAPFVWQAGSVLIVNPGSVGLSPQTGWRASYALLEVDERGVSVEHRQVEWDVPAFVRAFDQGIPVNRKAAPMLAELRQRGY